MVKIEIQGLRDIERAMLALPGKMDKKLLDQGLIQGAMLVRDEARNKVPLLRVPDARRLRGTVQRAIRAGRVRPEQYTATVWVRVRPLTGAQRTRFKKKRGKGGGADNPRDPFYWAFLEFGTSKHPARPFMRPAFESRKFAAVTKAIDTLRPLVAAEIDKLGAANRFMNNLRRAG